MVTDAPAVDAVLYGRRSRYKEVVEAAMRRMQAGMGALRAERVSPVSHRQTTEEQAGRLTHLWP